MTQFRKVTDDFSVSSQIGVEDVTRAAEQGFRLIINNRPEGEAPDQTSGREIEAAARELGLGYAAIPVIGGPTRVQAEAVQAETERAVGPVLAYCRSGTRSINTWALGQAMAHKRTAEELITLGDQAGYDLRPLLG